jgi:hypothetical protein
MEKLQKSMNIYMKAISKRAEIEDKEKTLPVAHLGGTMISHGEDFELDSEFGQCLTGQCFFPILGVSRSTSNHMPYSIWESTGANSSCSRKLYRGRYIKLA